HQRQRAQQGAAHPLAQLFDKADNFYGLQRRDFAQLQNQQMSIGMVQTLEPAAMRATLRNMQGIAALESTAFMNAHIQADHAASQAMQLTGKYFVQEATRLRRDHTWDIRAGNPVEAPEKLGAYVDRAQGDPTLASASLAQQVKHRRVFYTCDKSATKIFIEARDTETQTEVLAALVQLGAKIMKGTPPKSHQERPPA
ncbi:unnamed protein product, partial [Prorocentrum cordatum]